MWKGKLRDLMLTKLPKMPTDENPIKPLKHWLFDENLYK